MGILLLTGALCGSTAYTADDVTPKMRGPELATAVPEDASQMNGATVEQLAALLPRPTTSGSAYFGWSLAVDGDTMVAGTVFDDDNGMNAGAAWVFQRDQGGTDTWGEVTKLLAPFGESGDDFGGSAAISGDTIVIGALGYDFGIGAVYVFERDEGGTDAWGLTRVLSSPDVIIESYFGRAVAISGDTMVVGAYGYDPDGVYCGTAYIIERNLSGTWFRTATLRNNGGAANDFFGSAVAIDPTGTLVAVGAPRKNGTGEVTLFRRDQGGAGVWGEVAQLTAADGASSDEFGCAVSISGEITVVGAVDNSAAYIFSRDHGGSDAWGQLKKLTASSGGFGHSTVIAGDTLMVGAYRESAAEPSAGVVHVYARNQGGTDAWGQIAEAVASDGASNDGFGYSLALSGDIAVVSAIYDDDTGGDSGSVYVLDRNLGGADTWGEVAKQPAPLAPSARRRRFGTSVDIDGGIAVVGAPRDDDNGAESGSAYVFARDEGGAGMWGELTKLTASNGGPGRRFGTAVALSGDTMVIGNDAATTSEAVYVFTLDAGGAGWSETAIFTASPGSGHASFGTAVAIDADTTVVGAPNGAGGAYIFTRDGSGVWNEAAVLSPADLSSLAQLGWSVAVSGDTVLIGAPNNLAGGVESGSAYLFSRDEGGAGAWGLVARFDALEPEDDDFFGYSVAIDADTAVIGASGDQSNGRVYLLRRDTTGTWALQTVLVPPYTGYNFGRSVAIEGNTLAVGDAMYRLSLFSLDEGGAGAWGTTASLTRSSSSFGQSIAFDSIRPDDGAPFVDTMIVGLPDDDAVGFYSGSAAIFSIDEPAPRVSLVTSTEDTGDGELSEGEMTNAAISMLHLVLSRSAYDPIGDSEPDDVTNPANYLLLEAGPDGGFETVDCASGVAATDSAMVVGPVSWDPETLTTDLIVNGGQPLPDGRYRLLACGTTSIVGLDGRPLDGNDDGVGGDDLQRSFLVDRVMPVNPFLTSTSHAAGALSSQSIVDMLWFGASDAGGSGLAGYSIELDTSATTVPDEIVDLAHTAEPQEHSFGPLDDGEHWFHLRTCDGAGSCTATIHFGPLWIDATPPSTVSSLLSTSHEIAVPNTEEATVEMTWVAATDTSSAVAGYACELNESSSWTCSEQLSVTGTSTSVTAGNDGDWYFHICAVDAAGNWGAVATAGPYPIDLTAPQVSIVSSTTDTGDGVLEPGEITAASITQLPIGLSEPMWDPPGDTTTGDITSPDSYLLVGDGGDGQLDTTSCAGGPHPDDLQISIDQVLPDMRWATLQVNGGMALAAGSYRLLLCGAAIRDEAGNGLDGNGDGVGGDDFSLDFSVIGTNLLRNPNFDGSLDGWQVSSSFVGYVLADSDLIQTSGSTEVDGTGGVAGEHAISQCVALTSETGVYTTGGFVAISSSSGTEPWTAVELRFYDGADCSGTLLDSMTTSGISGDTWGYWQEGIAGIAEQPPGAVSVQVRFSLTANSTPYYLGHLDSLYLRNETIFIDGFEHGDTSRWPVTAP